MRIVDAATARALDERTIAAGTPGLVLMKRAAAAVAREIERSVAARPERGGRVAVLAGTGNNGGDGFEVARLLLAGGRVGAVRTILVGDPARFTIDAAETHRRLAAASGAVRVAREPKDLEPIRSATLVVDALFGTGLTRPLEPASLGARAVQLVRAARETGSAFVVAVDVPSGLDAGRSEPIGPHATADLTVTFGLPKVVHVHLPAAGACGRVVVADIGLLDDPFPPRLGEPEAVGARDVAPLVPRRAADAHKGSFGTLAIAGGSEGMLGAPALAARAALRAGSGKVVLALPEAARGTAHALSPESMTCPISADLGRFDGLAVGPGLGTSERARDLLDGWIGLPVAAVFDADALNLAAGRPEVFVQRDAATVLTPHPGEAARLLGRSTADVNADRVGSAVELAAMSAAVVVLKGFRTVIAAPDGRVAFVLAGNAGMATAGAGDVLTGVVGSFLARGLNAFDAARAGAFLHGAAGDLAREALGEESLVASDLVERLPAAFGLLHAARLP